MLFFNNKKCRYFGLCGGCAFQNIPYSEQVKQKLNFVLWKLITSGFDLPKRIKTFNSKPFYYRTRMDLVFSLAGPGLRRKEKYNEIIPIEHCPIANKKLNKLLQEVWIFFKNNKDSLDIAPPDNTTATIKYVTIRTPEFSKTTSLTFILNKESLRLAEQEKLLEEFAKNTTATNVILGYIAPWQDLSSAQQCRVIKGELKLAETFGNKTIQFHSQSFFQNNSLTTSKMLKYTRKLLKKYSTREKTLLDLYGGAGTFGLTNADLFQNLLIIDNNSENIAQAQENIQLNQVANAEAKCSDAGAISDLNPENLFIIVDPPRAGIHPKVLKKITALKPALIIYVSCKPEKMTEEFQELNKLYKLNSLAVFDQFPQTPHIEAIAELKLKT